MLQLIADLRGSLRERLLALAWMDEPTRLRALAKLDAFSVKIGYPEMWRDYSRVGIALDSYVKNVLRANAVEVRRNLGKIDGPVDKSEWGMTPPTVNAYFRPTATEIVFPAGILQPPFFDPKVDDAVNYGAIGVVIGHELTHGFNDSGRKYTRRAISPTDGLRKALRTFGRGRPRSSSNSEATPSTMACG